MPVSLAKGQIREDEVNIGRKMSISLLRGHFQEDAGREEAKESHAGKNRGEGIEDERQQQESEVE